MKRFLCSSFFLFTLPVLAHPPVSIVIDSQGNIFYSDLEQVWLITPEGTKTVAVPNVHTHELWIGPDNTLYGEDVTNVGENYKHRVWKRTVNGQLENELDWRKGHPSEYNDYGFAYDASGLTYVLIHNEKRINVLLDNEVVRTISLSTHEGYPHWLNVRPDGTLFLTIGDTLIQIEPHASEGTILASGLIERTPNFDFLHDRHALMGLWTDSENTVYVSVFSGQKVKQISPKGVTSTAYVQSGKWSIVGGTIDLQGRTLLLEFSTDNQTRVRRIEQKGETIF